MAGGTGNWNVCGPAVAGAWLFGYDVRTRWLTAVVIGATLPGTPAVTLGRNRFIAWGVTNLGADVEDMDDVADMSVVGDAGVVERLQKAAGEFLDFGALDALDESAGAAEIDRQLARAARHQRTRGEP